MTVRMERLPAKRLTGWWRTHRPTAIAMALTMIVLGGLYLWVDGLHVRALEVEARAAATSAATPFASSLGSAVNKRLSLVRGLAAFATVEAEKSDLPEDFAHFADTLRGSMKGVRNLSLAPGFVVRFINPMAGNEKVLGNELLKDPRPGFPETVSRAIQTRDVTTHGPLPLIQGGMGLIARQAVFVNGKPWGAVGAVFDLQPVLDEAGLAALAPRYSYVLRRADGAFVAGDPAVLVLDPIVERIQVANDQWELAVIPTAGWADERSSRPYVILRFVILTVLVQAIVVLLAERRIALARLVERRTRELSARSAELAKAKDELEQFAYAAAHDLQEPVRALGGYAQLLERHLGHALDSEGQELLGHIVGGAGRLKMLLHDVQLFVAEDRAPLPNEHVPADRALDGALVVLGHRLASVGADVSRDMLPVVAADERRLREIFLVLIGNATEYRDPERPLRIHVGARREDGFDVLTVSDNGIGIESRHQEQIFKVFRRLHGREEHPGTGMGLAIARKIAERLGGTVTLTSEPGAGSVFSLRLPAIDQGIQA